MSERKHPKQNLGYSLGILPDQGLYDPWRRNHFNSLVNTIATFFDTIFLNHTRIREEKSNTEVRIVSQIKSNLTLLKVKGEASDQVNYTCRTRV